MKQLKEYSSVSIALIGVCAVVALLSNLGSSSDVLQYLYISNPDNAGLQDVLSGQIWRLITPIFIHFGLMHFIFNMMWVWDLGNLIEKKNGAGFYVTFVLLVGVASNLAQYFFTGSPKFGGMSGVVYGLFGYIWIRGRYNPRFDADMHKTTVVMMLAWFALCWTGLLGPIANWAHTTGLVMGAAWAYLVRGSVASQTPETTEERARKHTLEYLSTADMLKFESQRQWVRDHDRIVAQYPYSTIDGKLKIIDAILAQKAPSEFKDKELRALEIAFGDALAQATGAQWGIFDDGKTRTPVLFMPDKSPVVYPLVAITTLMERGDAIDVYKLFKGAAEVIDRGGGM